jgi:RNA polymerase sigma factor (sigma-70 family)
MRRWRPEQVFSYQGSHETRETDCRIWSGQWLVCGFCTAVDGREAKRLPAVLNAIFAAHRRSLLWTVMRIVRDPQTAEDLAQETYLRARKAVEGGRVDHLEGFLHQTARNLAIDHLRRRKTRAGVEACGLDESLLADIPADIPSIEQALIEKQTFGVFQQALAGLPKRAQAVLVLSRIEEWSNVRIAEHLGISERTVFNDLKLAMAHCRDAMVRRERK